MPTIEAEFDVICSCGNDLGGNVESSRYGTQVTVEPCDKCLDKKYEEGIDDGISRRE